MIASVDDLLLIYSIADYRLTFSSVSTQTTIITFATEYIDTTVTTNVSTVTRTLNETSSVMTFEGATIPNTYNIKPGPTVKRTALNSTAATLFGSTMCVGPYLQYSQRI